MDHQTITKAIIKSQHCQRNWDLSREIPEDDLQLLITAGTQCPSKQNVAFYKLHYITNRTLIETIHENTVGFVVRYSPTAEYTTNPQTLANLLVIFEQFTDLSNTKDALRNGQTRALIGLNTAENIDKKSATETFERDRNVAVGVAAGYLNLTASLLGYSTGCCQCFDIEKIKSLLNLTGDPLLLMGIGFKDPNRNRRLHHLTNYEFPTKTKQEISVNVIK
jgi:nitroreductase